MTNFKSNLLLNVVIMMLTVTFMMSCKSTSNNPNKIKQVAQAYFSVFAERRDFQAFMSFYHDDAELQDLVYGNHVKGKQAIQNFFAWVDNPIAFKGPVSLVVTDQVVDGFNIVTRGYFVPFIYQKQEIGPWRFVIWQKYDESGKIIRQYDWINYTPKQDFGGDENLNLLIPVQQD